LSRSVHVAGVTWQTTMIVAGVGDLVYRIGDGRKGQILSDRMIGRLGDAVYGIHRARGDEKRWFLN
jgi:hypothetical protein